MDSWDVIVIGAGVGGLSAASLLAKEGLKVLLLEKEDRVGGRALSLKGEEVTEKGASWYRRLLAGQYCYLVESRPSLEEMAEKGALDGFTLDLGYHGVSVAGEGYFGVLRDLLDGYGEREVRIRPFLTGTLIKGKLFREPPLNEPRIDDDLYAEMARLGKKYTDFFGDLFSLTPRELAELDRVSLHEHLVKNGFAASPLLYEFFRCIGTLITTINNPHEISIGDILRYSLEVLAPAVRKGGTTYVGGFTEGGVMSWSEAVANRFVEQGGELFLRCRMLSIETDGTRVKGILARREGEDLFLRAPNVVFSLPIQELFRYIDPAPFPRSFVGRVASLYGYGSLCPYFGLSELPVPVDHAGRLIKTPCVVPRSLGFDWDVYMAWNIQSFIDPGCSPEGKHLFTAYLPLTEKESRNRELAMKAARAVPDFLESVYPGFKECIEWELYPVCVKLEGVAKSVTQAGSLKPDVEAPGVEGLFFAGDTVRGYGVAMDCACSSGILCASRITGTDYGIV